MYESFMMVPTSEGSTGSVWAAPRRVPQMEDQTAGCVAACTSPVENGKVYGVWCLDYTLNLSSTVIKTGYLGQKKRRAISSCKDGGLVEASLEARHLQALVSGSGRRVPTSQSHTSERRYGALGTYLASHWTRLALLYITGQRVCRNSAASVGPWMNGSTP